MFLNTELFGHQRGASNKGYKKIKYGTMVLSTQNLHLGNANVNQRFEHGMVSPAYKTYDISGCSIDLIAQWIKSDAAKRFFYNATTVGASVCRRNVEWDTLYGQSLFLPSLPEQEKIANLLTLLSNRIEEQRQLIIALKKYKRGLLNKVFSNINGNIYPTVYLSKVADFLQGLTYSPSDVSVSGYLVLRSSNIQNGVLSFDDCVYVDKKVDESLQVKCDDVIMCVRNGSKKLVGKTALIPNNMAMTTWGAFMMIIRSKLNDTYIFHYLNSQMFFSQVFKDTGTATINQITKGILNECKLPLPPETARKQISKMLSLFDVKIQNAEMCLTTLVELKKALLQQLFI